MLFKTFFKNKIYFCKDTGDPTTSSIDVMKKCFEVLSLKDDWLFYRLKPNCYDLGFIDQDELLISSGSESRNMISIAKIFKRDKTVKIVSQNWIEEDSYKEYLEEGKLLDIVEEMANLDNGSDGSDDSDSSSDNSSSDDSDNDSDNSSNDDSSDNSSSNDSDDSSDNSLNNSDNIDNNKEESSKINFDTTYVSD